MTIGDKTAARILADGARLEDLDKLDRLTGRTGALIHHQWDDLILWRTLIQLRTDIPSPPLPRPTNPNSLPPAPDIIGQLEPSNVFLTEDGDAALLDWEFADLFLPGFDLALLHTLFAGMPHSLDRIERIVTDRYIEVPFTINLAMVLTRDIRTHRELPDGPLRDERLPLIQTLWSHARKRLHTLGCR